MTDPIKAAALRWAEAIKTRNPGNVLDLYHPEGLLWGTLSPVVRYGHEAIYEYFIGFLQWEGLACSFNDGLIRSYGEFGFYSGTYEFTWKIGTRNVTVPARFSFIFKYEQGKWLILEHHSSLFPELPFKVSKYMKS